jgi:hypothetical protein
MKFLFSVDFKDNLYTPCILYGKCEIVLYEVRVCSTKGIRGNVTIRLIMCRHSNDCTLVYSHRAADSFSAETINSQRFVKHRRYITVFTPAGHFYLILSHTNPVQIFASYVFKIHLNIVLPRMLRSSKRPVSFIFFKITCLHFSPLPCKQYAPPISSSWV